MGDITDDISGKVKEVAGEVTGDKGLEAKGKAQQLAEDAKDKAGDIVNDVLDKAKEKLDENDDKK